MYNTYNIIQFNTMYETYVTICYKLHFFTFLVNSVQKQTNTKIIGMFM